MHLMAIWFQKAYLTEAKEKLPETFKFLNDQFAKLGTPYLGGSEVRKYLTDF